MDTPEVAVARYAARTAYATAPRLRLDRAGTRYRRPSYGDGLLAKITVYRFIKYDISSDENRKSRRWATRQAIERSAVKC